MQTTWRLKFVNLLGILSEDEESMVLKTFGKSYNRTIRVTDFLSMKASVIVKRENVEYIINARLADHESKHELLTGRASRNTHCIIIKQLYCLESFPCFPFVSAESWLMLIGRLTGVSAIRGRWREDRDNCAFDYAKRVKLASSCVIWLEKLTISFA